MNQITIADYIKIRYSLRKNLSNWENKFLNDILNSYSFISKKQKYKIEEIYNKVRFNRRSYLPLCVDVGDYDEAHNFDRD